MASICTVPASSGDGIEFAIANRGDFIIQLEPPKVPLVEKSHNTQSMTKRVLKFRVSKAVMSSSSNFFRDIFRIQSSLLFESRRNLYSTVTSKGPEVFQVNWLQIMCFELELTVPKPIISLENNGISHALEVWLRAVHGHTGLMPDHLAANRDRVWAAIAVQDQFGLHAHDASSITAWFKGYYESMVSSESGITPMVARSLVYPCTQFDHAEGFMKLTKYLAYNTNGTIIAHNPSPFKTLSLGARFLDGPLGAARADIQYAMERSISFPLEKLHEARCVCRKDTAFDYEDALRAVGCWPLAKAFKTFTVSEIIEKLSRFAFIAKNAKCRDSRACARDFSNDIRIAIQKGKNAFQGLCLDCMNRSTPTTGNQSQDDYIKKNSPFNGCWDMGCRYGHSFLTWHFSWMGTSTMRKVIVDKPQAEKPMTSTAPAGHGNTRSRGRGPAPRGRLRIPISSKDVSSVPPSISTKYTAGSINNQGNREMDTDEDDEFFDAETYMNADIHLGNEYLEE